MSRSLLAEWKPSNRILKRAQYEAFEFALFEGDVHVRNESYPDPANHEYRVTIENGDPIACECPADETYDEPCKHRLAVAIRPRLLELASTSSLLADGGRTALEDFQRDSGRESASDQCSCDKLAGEFPCWECVRTGRREVPA